MLHNPWGNAVVVFGNVVVAFHNHNFQCLNFSCWLSAQVFLQDEARLTSTFGFDRSCSRCPIYAHKMVGHIVNHLHLCTWDVAFWTTFSALSLRGRKDLRQADSGLEWSVCSQLCPELYETWFLWMYCIFRHVKICEKNDFVWMFV